MLKCPNKNIVFTAFTVFSTLVLAAQQSTHSARDNSNTPLDLSKPFDLIVFIILPIVCIVLYIIWFRRMKKEKLKAEEEKKANQKANAQENASETN